MVTVQLWAVFCFNEGWMENNFQLSKISCFMLI